MGSRTAVKTPKKFNQPKEKLISGAELYAMDDIGPSELIRGRIVHHMPTGHAHGFIENLIAFFLTLFNREHQLGRVLTGEVGIYTQRDPDTIRAADVAFISHTLSTSSICRFSRCCPRIGRRNHVTGQQLE